MKPNPNRAKPRSSRSPVHLLKLIPEGASPREMIEICTENMQNMLAELLTKDEEIDRLRRELNWYQREAVARTGTDAVSGGAFMDKARKLDTRILVGIVGLFAGKCWPELIAVVEAAQAGHKKAEFRGIDKRGFLYENTPLGDALDALDSKAGEL